MCPSASIDAGLFFLRFFSLIAHSYQILQQHITMTSPVFSSTDVSTNLRSLLMQIANHIDPDFSGLGIIVWDGVTVLPIHPMREGMPDCMRQSRTPEILNSISRESSSFHDGFHVLNQSLRLTQASVYFSPAIVPDLVVPAHARKFGGRYLAAVFGSCLPGVLCTGVLSRSYGPYVFRHGKEI